MGSDGRTVAMLGCMLLAACAGSPEEEVDSGEGEIITRPSLVARHVEEGAVTIDGAIDDVWSRATATKFDTAWSGDHTATTTTVRALWTESALYMLWELD